MPQVRPFPVDPVLTGIALMGLIPVLGQTIPRFADPDYAKLGVKLVVALVVGVLAFIGRRKYKKGEEVGNGLAHSVGGLGLLNVAIATLWH